MVFSSPKSQSCNKKKLNDYYFFFFQKKKTEIKKKPGWLLFLYFLFKKENKNWVFPNYGHTDPPTLTFDQPFMDKKIITKNNHSPSSWYRNWQSTPVDWCSAEAQTRSWVPSPGTNSRRSCCWQPRDSLRRYYDQIFRNVIHNKL